VETEWATLGPDRFAGESTAEDHGDDRGAKVECGRDFTNSSGCS